MGEVEVGTAMIAPTVIPIKSATPTTHAILFFNCREVFVILTFLN